MPDINGMPDETDVAFESVFGQGRQMMLAQALRGQQQQSFAPPGSASPPVQSAGVPIAPAGQPRRESPADLYTQAEGIRKQAYGLAPDPQVEQAEREKANANAFYGSAIQTLGGSRLGATGGHVLKQAMARQSELERNPERDLTRRQAALLAEAAALERRAQMTQNAEDRAILQRQAEAAKLEAQKDRDNTLRAIASMNAGDRATRAAERQADREDASRTQRVDKTRREYNAIVQKVQEGAGFADSVVQMLADPKIARSAEGQIALVMQFGKMLDPQSVVREAEQQMIANARGWADRIGATPERIRSGQFLTPQQLREMATIADQYRKGTQQRVSDIDAAYAGLAERNRLPVEDIITKRGLPGGAPQSQAPSAPKLGGTVKFGDLQ